MTVFEKIEAQQAKLKGTEPAWMVGEQLKDICRTDPHCADIVAEDLESEAMSLEKAAAALKKYSDENRGKARCFCITPKVADQILRKFYGLPETPIEPVPAATGTFDLSAFM